MAFTEFPIPTIELMDSTLWRSFTTRALLAAEIVGGMVPIDGMVYEAAGVRYRGQTSATSIPDLLGLVPEGDYTPQHFGAVGDGTTDDSTAVSRWLDYIIANNLQGYAPKGDYLLNTFQDKTVGTWRGGISGSGKGSTRFIVPATNTSGAISFTSTARDSQVEFSDFSVITSGAGGVGFRFRQPEGGNQHQRSVIVRNIAVRGSDKTNDYFATFLSLAGTWRPLVEDVQIDGPFVGVDNADASLRFASDVGIDLDGAYDPTVNDCHVWGAEWGIRANVYQGIITSFADNGSGATRVTISNTWAHPFSSGSSVRVAGAGAPYDGTHSVTNVSATQFDIPVTYTTTSTGLVYLSSAPEAFRMTNTVINGCKIGLDYVRPPGREPIVWIDNCHVNYRNYGYRIEGAKLVTIQASHPYNEDSANEFSGVPHDIYLVNASEYIITGNTFHFAGAADRIPVQVDNDGTSNSGSIGIIAHNLFNCTGTWAIWLANSCRNVIVGPNMYAGGTFSSGLVNDVSNENIIIDGKTETTGTWTPALTFGGGSTGITYSAQTGSYNIVGGVLHFTVSITLTSKGSSTGSAQISLPTGLPGPKVIQVGQGIVDWPTYSGMASIVSPSGRVVSATLMTLITKGTTQTSALTDANFINTASFTINGTIRLV